MTDPNELLARLRDAVTVVEYHHGEQEDVSDLVAAFANLDAHLSEGGTVPDAWDRWAQVKRRLDEYERVEVEPLGPPDPAHGELPEVDPLDAEAKMRDES